ncbi:MAG: AAA family ATPase [Candidatus Peribacteria bacterium]|nr:MAG: AAA family ATPase [Candidatus Peribacteria bacterium]
METIKTTETRIQTSSQELNTVLGGGIVQGSVVLLSGEPGIGKSTLTLQLANWVDEDIVYISGEETEHQIFERSERLKVKNDKLSLLAESNIENILTTLQQYPTHHSVPSSVSES